MWSGTPEGEALEASISKAVHDMLAKRDGLLEEMCMAMIFEGRRGLKVVESLETMTVELSDEVPLGEIHWHRDYTPALDFSVEDFLRSKS